MRGFNGKLNMRCLLIGAASGHRTEDLTLMTANGIGSTLSKYFSVSLRKYTELLHLMRDFSMHVEMKKRSQVTACQE